MYKKITQKETVDIYSEHELGIVIFDSCGNVMSCNELFTHYFFNESADTSECINVFDIIIGFKFLFDSKKKLTTEPDLEILKAKVTHDTFIYIRSISLKLSESSNTFLFKIEKDQVFENDFYIEKKAFKKLLDSITQPVFIKNNLRQYIYVNRPFCVHFERNIKKILYKTHEEIFPNDESTQAISDDLKVLSNNEEIEIPQFKHLKDNGEEMTMFCLKTPFVSQQKNTYQLGVLIENAERKKAENAAKAKSDFLSVMSHELRTPLNSIVGITNLLIYDNPRPDQLEHLNILKFSNDNLLSLISNILDFDKIDSGKIDLEFLSIDLQDFLNKIKSLHHFKAQERRNNLYFLFEGDLPENIYCDPTRLSQVLNNLINNAIKYTENGEITIKTEIKRVKNDQVEILFSVTDSGIGINEDKLEVIFEPFVQASLDTTRKYGGSGLGLAITKRLVEIMGGEIRVSSKMGIGSTFSFGIILKIDTKNKTINDKQVAIQNEQSALKGLRILLVEDNLFNVMIINKFLNRWGVEADVAYNGHEAIEKISSNEYDIVLMDLHMPGIDGFEATEKIRTLSDIKYQKIPILALTADALSDVREKALNNGFNDLISKPFSPEELLQKIVFYTAK